MPISKEEVFKKQHELVLHRLKSQYDYLDKYLSDYKAINISTALLFKGIDSRFWNEAFELLKKDYQAVGWEVKRNQWSDQREEVDVDQIVIS